MTSSPNPDQLYRTATAWLARRQSSGWTDVDERELQAWLQADPSHEQAYRRMVAAQGGLGDGASARGAGGVPGGRSVPAQRRSGWGWGWWLASAVGLALAVWLTVSFVLRESSPGFTERVRVEGGQARDWKLPDGSVVSLNSGTEAGVGFYSRRRELVMSQGQGLFRVAYVPRTSFIVRVGNEDVTVDGGRVPIPDTVFDVRSAPGVLEVGVATGKVKVRTVSAGAREEVVLEAGNVIRIDLAQRRHEIAPIAPEAVGAWRTQ